MNRMQKIKGCKFIMGRTNLPDDAHILMGLRAFGVMPKPSFLNIVESIKMRSIFF